MGYIEKPTYRSEIIAALCTLGGQGKLKDIYDVIENRNLLPAISTNTNWQAQVRKQLQSDNDDMKTQTSGKNLFWSVEGKGSGIWGLRDLSQYQENDLFYNFSANGEIIDNQTPIINNEFIEGATKKILVNKYERNYKLREKCIELFGCLCTICSFNFEEFYGLQGKGFIEVHHITPISAIGHDYIAHPDELRPVCSNCHSMIHRYKPFLQINELKDLIKIQKSYNCI
jgi:5-methylcytosine-specific restriction protein A